MRFTINAAGGGTLTHKWQKNGADLNPLPEGVSGEATNTLRIKNVAKSHEGTYSCIVSNEAGPIPSNPAQLTVRKCLIQLPYTQVNKRNWLRSANCLLSAYFFPGFALG